jgi:hypothetical protein
MSTVTPRPVVSQLNAITQLAISASFGSKLGGGPTLSRSAAMRAPTNRQSGQKRLRQHASRCRLIERGEDHPKATRTYAWSLSVEGSDRRRFHAVLHLGALDRPKMPPEPLSCQRGAQRVGRRARDYLYARRYRRRYRPRSGHSAHGTSAKANSSIDAPARRGRALPRKSAEKSRQVSALARPPRVNGHYRHAVSLEP